MLQLLASVLAIVVCEDVILFRLIAAIFCHFLANLMSFLVLIIFLLYELEAKIYHKKMKKGLVDIGVMSANLEMGRLLKE